MYLTRGIIIKKKDKGENDKTLTLFTKDYGKLAILAKGVRKSSSRLAAHIELFSFSEVGFVIGKIKGVLTSAEELNSFSSIKKNSKKIKAASHIAALVFENTLEEEKDEGIFNLLCQAFSYLDEKEFSELELEYFLRYFEFKLLSLLGYRPQEEGIGELFSASSKKVSKRALEEAKLLFTRYFKNIFNEV